MFRPRFLSVAVALVVLVAIAPAPGAPVPPKKPRPVISAANADKVRSVKELEMAVWRIVPGPAKGELTFVHWEKPIEVVADEDYRSLRKIADGKKLIHFAASKDGKRMAWCENNTQVVVQELPDGKPIAIETKNDQPQMAFSPDGKLLATGGYGTEAKLWNIKGEAVRALDCGGEGGLWPVFSPDGKLIAVGNRNDETRIFEVATGKLLSNLPKKFTHEIAFSPDGKMLAASYVDGTVTLWDVAKGSELYSAASGATEIFTLDWSPKGDVLVTAGLAGKITLWNPAKLTVLKELDGPAWVISVRFTPDGTRILSSGGSENSGTHDRKVIVWAIPED